MSDNAAPYKKLSDVPDSDWQKIATKRIYFGHQSVGYNIIDGLQTLIAENPNIRLEIKETYDPDIYQAGHISHSQIGYNGNPKSKLDMFSFIAKSGGAEKADIMLFKFCYVDFNAKTDVEGLFQVYKSTFDNLKAKYPNTTFIHSTVPLTTIQGGPKAFIKKILDRPISGIEDNIKRNQFNELLRKEYSDKGTIFDIAAAESTLPDGQRETFELKGQTYYYLVPAYTNDGGHLNEAGKRKVAEQLLLTIVKSL